MCHVKTWGFSHNRPMSAHLLGLVSVLENRYSHDNLPSCRKRLSLNVCYNMNSHPDMLTEKEVKAVTIVFRSFESGLREATIKPRVNFLILSYMFDWPSYTGPPQGIEDAQPEPH